MRTYIVFIPKTSKLKENELPPNRYKLSDGLWAIGSPSTTSSSLCDNLGIGRNGLIGVVVPMKEFYGYYDNALWQRLEDWRSDKNE